MKRIAFIVFIICSLGGTMSGQTEAQFSQHHMALGYYNPAWAGSSGDINATSIYKRQWAGMDDTPGYYFVQADMPIHLGVTRHGVGVLFYSNEGGLYKNTLKALQYNFKYRLWGGEVAIGIQPGIYSQKVKGSTVRPEEDNPSSTDGSGDTAMPTTDISGSTFDINMGLYFRHKQFYMGIGMLHAGQPSIELDEIQEGTLQRSFNFAAGYNIQLKNSLFELQPAVFMQSSTKGFYTDYTQSAKTAFYADITGRVVYDKKFNAGVTWRTGAQSGVICMIGAMFDNFQVGYAYDYTTSRTGKSAGSHEVVARINFRLKKASRGSAPHKSVRIL